MKDFGQWFAGQGSVGLGPAEPAEPTTAAQLADMGFEVDDDHEGNIIAVYADCCRCERRINLTDYASPDEIAAGPGFHEQYCGGSPRCCP